MRPGATLHAPGAGRSALLTAAFLAGLAAAPAPGAAQSPPPDSAATVRSPPPPPLGPLTAEEGAPLQRLGLTPMVEMADPVGAGAFRTEMWVAYTNVFEQDSAATHNLYLDMERVLTALTLRYGVTDRLEVGGRATLESTFGGILDPVVVALHDLLRMGSGNRDLYPEGAYGQRLEENGDVLVDIERRSLALDEVRFFGKWLLHAGSDGSSAVAVRGEVRVPTRTNHIGAESTDVGLVLLGRNRWRRLHLHGMLGGTTVRSSPELARLLNQAQYFAMAGGEYPFSTSLSGVLEFTLSSPLVRDFGNRDVDGHLSNAVFGVVYRTGGGWRWEVAMQEDVPPWGPSLDFTLQLGVSRSW